MKPARLAVACVAAAIVFAWMAAGCATAREKTIRATLTTTDAARAAFMAYDVAHIEHIARTAPDEPTANGQLATWQVEWLKINGLLLATYSAIAAAATLDTATSVTTLLGAATSLANEMKAIGAAP